MKIWDAKPLPNPNLFGKVEGSQVKYSLEENAMMNFNFFRLTLITLFLTVFSFVAIQEIVAQPMEAFPCESVGSAGSEIVNGCCLDPAIVGTDCMADSGQKVCVGHSCNFAPPTQLGCNFIDPNTNALAGAQGQGNHFTRCDWVPKNDGSETCDDDNTDECVTVDPPGICDIGCVDYNNSNLIDPDCSDFASQTQTGQNFPHRNDRIQPNFSLCGGGDDDDDSTGGGDDDDDMMPPTGGDPDTSANNFQLYCYYDIRDSESYCQITNISSVDITVHVQVFDVSNNCNENNFNDNYTPNDTHVYDLNDIKTNDGNPSGIDLPPGAYGFVVVTAVAGIGGLPIQADLIGNFRVISSDGAEYRTNALGISIPVVSLFNDVGQVFTINFNKEKGIILSDVVGITVDNIDDFEVTANIPNTFAKFDVNILNNNEDVFSCRDIVFACTDQDHPLLDVLFKNSGSSVASFEYGINETISHSHDGELLCPGNNITEGFVELTRLTPSGATDLFIGYIGLNNGNGRGSMSAFWNDNFFIE